MSEYLLISDAAKEVQVESHVLRYWEEELHLPIKRNELGHRFYTQEDVERFRQIKNMKERGLQLKAIKMILRDGRLDLLGPGPKVQVQRVETAEKTAEAQGAKTAEKTAEAGTQGAETAEKGAGAGTQGAKAAAQNEKAEHGTERTRQGAEMEPQKTETAQQSIGAESRRKHAAGEGLEGAWGLEDGWGEEDGVEAWHAEGEKCAEKTGEEEEAAHPHMAIEILESRELQPLSERQGQAETLQMLSERQGQPETLQMLSERQERSEKLQWILRRMMQEAVRENNEELVRTIKESVIKELDYQFRMQEERQEEREKENLQRSEEYYRRMDELLREKSHKKTIRRQKAALPEKKAAPRIEAKKEAKKETGKEDGKWVGKEDGKWTRKEDGKWAGKEETCASENPGSIRSFLTHYIRLDKAKDKQA